MMSIIIVVEGIHDEMRVKAVYPNANVVITNGREISLDTINLIKKLSENNEIVIFTDPDSPGEKIRRIIMEAVPNAKNAFLRKKDAISKNGKKVGIEHTTDECIIEALNNVYSGNFNNQTISMKDLFELKLNGDKNSAILREKISSELNIGKPNAKTFLNRLNMLQINKEELKKLCLKLEI